MFEGATRIVDSVGTSSAPHQNHLQEHQAGLAQEEDDHRPHVIEDIDGVKSEVAEALRHGVGRLEPKQRVDIVSKVWIDFE